MHRSLAYVNSHYALNRLGIDARHNVSKSCVVWQLIEVASLLECVYLLYTEQSGGLSSVG